MNQPKMKLIGLITAVFFLIPVASLAAVDVKLRIEGPDQNFVSSPLVLPESCSVVESGTSTPRVFSGDKAICALEQARADDLISTYQVTDWGFGYSLDAINHATNTPDWSQSWTIRINNIAAQTGIDGASLQSGDMLLLAYGPWPLEPLNLRLATSTSALNQPVEMSTEVWNDTNNQFENFYATSTFWINGEKIESASGTISWTPAATGTVEAWVEASGKARSDKKILEIIEATASSSDSGPGNDATGTPPVESAGSNSSAGGGGTVIVHQTIDTAKAVKYLLAGQLSDGSIGGDRIVSDWAALALAAVGADSDAREKLKNYLLADDPGAKTTDYERRAMALMALGVDPYSAAGKNYIEKIVSAFDGNQLGDSLYFNDDIFGIFPLFSAGYSNADAVIAKTISFILASRQADGSWGGVDLTAAAIQALAQAKNRGGLEPELETNINEALLKAKNYLKSAQQNTGQIGSNSMSTSWSIQAINALGESPFGWEKNYHNPNDFLRSQQQSDGGMEETTAADNIRLWSTAYAITASTDKTWSGILNTFPRPVIVVNAAGGLNNASSSADTTQDIASTSLPEATLKADETGSTTAIIVQAEAAFPAAPEQARAKEQRKVNAIDKKVKGVKISNYAGPINEKPDNIADLKSTSSNLTEAKNIPDSNAYLSEKPNRNYAKFIFFFSSVIALTLGLYLIMHKRISRK